MKKNKAGTGVLIGSYKSKFSYNLAVINYKEGEETVIFCPALDLCAYGSNLREAEKAFQEVLKIYLAEVEENGTLESDLIRLGWELSQTKISPPKITKLININPQFRKVLSSDYTQRHKKINLPLVRNGLHKKHQTISI